MIPQPMSIMSQLADIERRITDLESAPDLYGATITGGVIRTAGPGEPGLTITPVRIWDQWPPPPGDPGRLVGSQINMNGTSGSASILLANQWFEVFASFDQFQTSALTMTDVGAVLAASDAQTPSAISLGLNHDGSGWLNATGRFEIDCADINLPSLPTISGVTSNLYLDGNQLKRIV